MEYNPAIKTILTEDRVCENCGCADLETLSHYEHDAKTRNHVFRFDVNNVICRGCGFVFVSPVHVRTNLLDYYSDSYSSYAGQLPDYDIDKRIEFIYQVAKGYDLMVEIGSNQQSDFQRRLHGIFNSVVTVEINDSVSWDRRSMSDIPGSADMVAHYFVLEHIPQVKPFLNDCAKLLKPNGIMIVEVPDISLYPSDPGALANHEHTNHFSLPILDQLATQCGFVLVATSRNLCSRPFGFVAAYQKGSEPKPQCNVVFHYAENKGLFLNGVGKLARLRKLILEKWTLVQRYESEGKQIVFWAANEMMDQFLGGGLNFLSVSE